MLRALGPLALVMLAPYLFDAGCECDGGDGPWNPGHDASTVLPKVSALSDDFNDNARAAIWGAYASPPAAAVNEVNQRLEISLNGGAAYAGYRTVDRYDATGASTWVGVSAVGIQDNNHEMLMAWYGLALDELVYIEVNGGLVFGGYRAGDGGSFSTVPDAGAAAVRVFRLREQLGVTSWEYSTDGGAYHTFLTLPDPIDLSAVQVDLSAGFNQPTGVPALDAFDDLNR